MSHVPGSGHQTNEDILLAYHGDPALRADVLARMRAHVAADEIIQGYDYWEDCKGCAVGCLTRDRRGGHAEYPLYFGIPEVLAYIEDRLFEALDAADAKAWPVRFLDAIPLGADLNLAWPRFAHALLVDPVRGVLRLTRDGSSQRISIEAVAALCERQICGGSVAREEWDKARKTSGPAYVSYPTTATAHLVATATATAMTSSMTYAASASTYAAYVTTCSVYGRAAHYKWQASTLLEILASCPVPS